MATRRRLRRFALWTCIAIPALTAMYFGAYYRMVTPLSGLALRNGNQFYLQASCYYSLPWPLPAHWNQASQQHLRVLFAPAHRLDRAIRPDTWHAERYAGAGIRNSDGSFTLTDDE